MICRGLNPAKISDSDAKRLLEVLSDFPPYLILILYLEGEEFNADKTTLKKKNVQALSAKMDFVSFPIQEERVLLPWSKKILAADGIDAQDATLRVLFRLSGNRMNIIRRELEKLATFALSQNRTLVTEEDVLLFAQDTTEFQVFNLCDAVLGGSENAVARIFASLKAQEVEPVIIGAALAKALMGALMVVEGADAAACQKAAGMFPWQHEKYRRSLFGMKKEWLEEALRLSLQLDRKLKGARSDAMLVTEVAVLEMTRILGGKK